MVDDDAMETDPLVILKAVQFLGTVWVDSDSLFTEFRFDCPENEPTFENPDWIPQVSLDTLPEKLRVEGAEHLLAKIT